jgi:hypothetical protein
MRHIIPIRDSHNNTMGQEATLSFFNDNLEIALADGRRITLSREMLGSLMAIHPHEKP